MNNIAGVNGNWNKKGFIYSLSWVRKGEGRYKGQDIKPLGHFSLGCIYVKVWVVSHKSLKISRTF